MLCAGTPGVWGEAVKAMLFVKRIEYTAVAMTPGFANPELVAWTGQSSAPAIVTAENKVLTHWEQFIWLAEELAPTPALVPDNLQQRMTMFALLREIAGVNGVGWLRRLQSLNVSGGPQAAEQLKTLADKYGYSETAVSDASIQLKSILAAMAAQLLSQQQQGSHFFVGRELSALDLYAAVFVGVMIRPLPAEQIPMPDGMRWAFTEARAGTESLDPIVTEHCKRIFAEYLPTQLDF